MVALLLPHLLEGVGEVEGGDLLGILELQKLVAAVARHVDQDVGVLVRQQPLAARHLLADTVREQPDEVLDGHLVAAVVDFDIGAVEVNGAVAIGVDGAGEGVARVAGHVVGEHEDDLGVGDAEALDGAVEGEDIGEVTVVEPEARGRDEDGPVGGVFAENGRGEGEEERGEEGEGEGDGESWELHFEGDVGILRSIGCIHEIEESWQIIFSSSSP